MKYRKLDSNGDYSWGHGDQDFLIDSPAAVAQAITTTLKLFQGEWFLDLTAGVPWFTQVGGFNTQDIYDTIVKDAIRNVGGVLSITKYQSSLDTRTRDLTINVSGQSEFGSFTVSTTTNLSGYGVGGYGMSPYGE
jgi:hypothetical protein